MLARLPRRVAAHAVRGVLVLGLIATTLWTGAVGCLWMAETNLVFRANRSRVILPFQYDGLVQLTTADGVVIDAVALPASQPSDFWILFCPPAAGTIHGRLQSQLAALQEMGYNVFAFDYRGFGRNRGRPSEAGVYEDALAAYRHLVEIRRVPPSRVILAGRSLGSAVAVELSTRVGSAGILLLSALDSVPAAASRIYPWAPVGLLATQRFDSVAKVQRVRGPVLMVHGTRDRLIPIRAAREMFEAFPDPKLMLETSGGHNRAGFGDDASLTDALARFWPVALPRAVGADSE